MPYKRRLRKRSAKRRSRPYSNALSKSLKSLASSIRGSKPRSAAQQRRAEAAKIRRQALKMMADEQNAAMVQPLLAAAKAQADAAPAPLSNKDIFKSGRVRGRGGYWGKMFGDWLGGLTGNSTIKSLMSSAFDSAGDYLAGAVPGGNLIAAGSEALHKSISGSGDYTINDAMSHAVPSFGGGEVDHIRVRSREYLGPISGSSDFKLDSRLLINPGNHAAFPQLAKLAAHYQQYIMKGLIFYYKTTSSVAVNTADPALGQVIMAFNYDATEPSYSSKAEMLQSQYCSAGAPCQDIVHGVECAPFTNGSEVKRIRHGDPSENISDPLNTDLGTFQLAVEGTNLAATRVGELWVTYDCVLIKSRDSKGSEVPLYDATFSGDAVVGPFETLVQQRFNTIGMEPSSDNAFYDQPTTLVFPRFMDDGKYLLQWQLINPAPSDPITGQDFAVVQNLEYGLRYPTFNTRGCTITSISNRPDGDMLYNGSGVNILPSLAAKAVATYIVDIRTTITQPVAMIKVNLNETVWPVNKSSGQTRIIISRIPDLLSV